MAKEFKKYDKKYKEFEGQYLFYEKAAGVISEIEILSSELDRWPYPCEQPSTKEAREAVYFTWGWETWQKFRVSLKGQPTSLKLARLIFRRILKAEDSMERIRIDNYIFALKRGGQLDNQLNIQR